MRLRNDVIYLFIYNIISQTLDSKDAVKILPQHNSEYELANSFNNFYIDKVNKIRDSLPKVDLVHTDFEDFEGNVLNQFQPITVDQLHDIIKESKTKTCPNEPLPSNLLNSVSDCLLPYFCHLINKSFLTGELEGIKESVVRPLLKKAGLGTAAFKSSRPVPCT